MTNITITEALAEIKTINKRIASKQTFINQHLARVENIRDPHEKDGGSFKVIQQELQGVNDLMQRIVDLRRGIQTANEKTSITIEGETKTISDWLTWRREVAPLQRQLYNTMNNNLRAVRDRVRESGRTLARYGQQAPEEKPADVVVNINELELAANSEKIENILGQLDGQLSLKNATITIS